MTKAIFYLLKEDYISEAIHGPGVQMVQRESYCKVINLENVAVKKGRFLRDALAHVHAVLCVIT